MIHFSALEDVQVSADLLKERKKTERKKEERKEKKRKKTDRHLQEIFKLS